MFPGFEGNLPNGIDYSLLSSLLQTGMMPAIMSDAEKYHKRSENGLVGLLNQGATCYLNSLLQVLFFVPELRYHFLRLDPNLLGSQYLDNNGRIITSENKEEQEKINQSVRTIPLYLQQLYSELLLTNKEAISTKLFTSEGLGWKNNENFDQQDIAELNRLLLDWIEKSLVNIESMKNIIPYLYEGTVSQVIECSECKNKSERDEVIRDLIVPLSGEDLIDCINEYLKVEELKGDNKYNCEKCNKKVNAMKGMKIKKFAPFLQFSLNRFVYDMRTYQRRKLNKRCEFPLVIDTSLFLSDKIENINDIKSKMIWITDLHDSSEKINEIIDKSKSYGNNGNIYDLVAIVCHNGSAFGGHYTVYIRDVFSEESESTKTEGINEDNEENNEDEDDVDSVLPIFTNTWLDKLMNYYYTILIGKLEEKGLKNGGLFELILQHYFEDFKKGCVSLEDDKFKTLMKIYHHSYLQSCFIPVNDYITKDKQHFLVCKDDLRRDAIILREISNDDLEKILIEERTIVTNSFKTHDDDVCNMSESLSWNIDNQITLLTLENKPFRSALEIVFMLFDVSRSDIGDYNKHKEYIINKWYNGIYDKCFGNLELYIKNSKALNVTEDFCITHRGDTDCHEVMDIIRNERTIVADYIRNYNETNPDDKIYSFENSKELYNKYKKEILPNIDENKLPYLSGLELLITESSILSRNGDSQLDLGLSLYKKWNEVFYDKCLCGFVIYYRKSEFIDVLENSKKIRLFPFKFNKLKNAIMNERNMMLIEMNRIDDSNITFSQESYDDLINHYKRSIKDIEFLEPGPFELLLNNIKQPEQLSFFISRIKAEWASCFQHFYGYPEMYIRKCKLLKVYKDLGCEMIKLNTFQKNDLLDLIAQEREEVRKYNIKSKLNMNDILHPSDKISTKQKKINTANEKKINKYFGKWYYFNDDKVTQLSNIFGLEDMFGDNKSPANGYMLFYRSRILNKDNTNGILIPKIIYNKVPEFWSSKIENENSEFDKKYEEEQKEMKKKEIQLKSVNIHIYTEKSIEITDDVVLKYKEDTDEKESQYFEKTLKFSELQKKFKEVLKINSNENIHIYRLISVQNKCTSPEYKGLKYYHIDKEIKPFGQNDELVTELGIENGDNHLILTDSYVKSHVLAIGSQNEPIITTFHILYLDQKVDTKIFPYGINKSNMVSRLFYISASLLGTEKDEIRISYKKHSKKTGKAFADMIKDDITSESTTIEEYFKDTDNIEIYVEKKTESYNGRMLVFRELDKESSSTDLNIYLQNKNNTPQLLLSKSFLSTLHLREFCDILKQYIPDDCKEWCLEYTLPFQEGLPSRALKLRNNEAKYVKDVKDLTLHLYEKSLLEDEIELYCSLWNEKGVSIETLKTVIDRRLTVYELKKQLFALFDIAKEPKKDHPEENDDKEKEKEEEEETPEEIEYKQLLDNRRVVKIPQSGPIKPLNEENRTIIQVGLNHGDYISLENHKPLIKGNVIVKINLFDSMKTDFSDIYPSDSEYKKEEAYELSMKMRESTVIPLGDGIMIEENKKIGDLKRLLMNNEIVVEKAKEMKIEDFTVNNIRIHEYYNDKKSPYFYSTGKLFHDAFSIKQLDSKNKEYICVLTTEQIIISPSDIYYNLLIMPHNERKPKWPYDEIIIRKPKNYNITYFEVVNAISNKTKIDKDFLLCAMLLKDWTWKILSPSVGKRREKFEYPEYCVIWAFSIEKIKIAIKPEFLRRDDIENYLDIKQKEILANKKSKKKVKPRENDLKLGVQLQFSPSTPDSEVTTKQEEMEWSCSQCTFINSANLQSCEICGFPRK